jgi:transcriptional/translational regulatory protein YebC/TACO1
MAGHSRWANIRRRERARKRQPPPGKERAGLERVLYEGYGPAGAAVLVECFTNDRRRLGDEVRRALLQHGGQMGADGAVRYLFNEVGLLTYRPQADARGLVQAALEAGAEEVVRNADRSVEVLVDPLEFAAVHARLTSEGFAPATAEVTLRAACSLALSGEEAQLMLGLLEGLEGLEEVRNVYTNAEIADEVLLRNA